MRSKFLRFGIAAGMALALGACAANSGDGPRPLTAVEEPGLRSTPEGLALVRLAMMHRRGDGVAQDLGEMRRLLVQAMGKGEPVAYVEMGLLAANGDAGVPKDEAK